jgi:hypothetical protein
MCINLVIETSLHYDARSEKRQILAQSVSHRPITAKIPVQFQVSPRGICGGQSSIGSGVSPSSSVFLVNLIPPVLCSKPLIYNLRYIISANCIVFK